ncbi:MAG: hypothetical protein ACE5GX_10210, partial [Thermoanaerobaculia bacterium]
PRFPDWRHESDAPDRIGLALSGGGIRSATFNLGMLQKLAEFKLLSGFDYLATVSGGGYIGSFWSAWLCRQKQLQSLGKVTAPKVFPTRDPGKPEPRPVRHLREFSNFLRPRMSLFSFSTGRIAAGLISAIVPCLLVALMVISVAIGFWLLVASLFVREGSSAAVSAWWMFGLTFVAHYLVEFLWLRRPEDPEARARLAYAWWAIASSTVAAVLWLVLWRLVPLPYSFLFRPLASGQTQSAQLMLAFWPLLAWGGSLGFLIAVRVAFSRSALTDYDAQARQAALGRAISRVIFCLVLWAMGAIVWVAGQWLAAVGPGGVAAAISTALAGGGSFGWARGLLSAQPNKPTGEGFAARLRPLLPKLIAVITLAAAAASTASIVILIYQAVGNVGPKVYFGVVLVLLGVVCVVFEPQENGFHSLYRARLTRAYLGATNVDPAANGEPLLFATEVRRNDDIRIDDLTSRPFHLVCCAANDLSADGLRTLNRGAESAVLSKVGFQVGDAWRDWGTKQFPTATVPHLSHAVTASASAFNSHMGTISMRIGNAATFLLTALGLRLGLWVEGPVGTQEHYRQRSASLQRNFPGLLFLRELLGFSRSRGEWVHLSDGAHFENLALYELIRRHCRYILVSDCGADPDVAFDDFGNAVRRVREDFGVEIEIDLAALRPAKDDAAKKESTRQPVVAGDIHYPGGDNGILLYVKPTLSGNEPEDITQYARRNGDFPHETTLDQFYDEAQWEAYRRLGEHVIDEALENIRHSVAVPGSGADYATLVRYFLEARLAWPSSTRDDVAVLAGLDKEWTALEQKIVADGASLRDELFPGLPAVQRTTASLVENLPHVQEALRLMVAVYLRSGIADSPKAASHPRFQGWLNRFGRWYNTYDFKTWWPWLAPLQNRSFVEFMSQKFDGLSASKRHKAQLISIRPGMPHQGWLDPWSIHSARLPKSRPGVKIERFGLVAKLGPEATDLLAAVADLELDATTVTLKVEHFNVPPGLWSIGIGEVLVDKLVAHMKAKPGVTFRVRAAPSKDDPKKKVSFSAEQAALFVGAGFSRDGSDPKCEQLVL